LVTCEKCGHENSKTARYCVKCGSELLTPFEKELERKKKESAEKTHTMLLALSFTLMIAGLLISFCLPYPIYSETEYYNPITKRYETISSTVIVYGHPFGFVLDGIGFILLLYVIMTKPE